MKKLHIEILVAHELIRSTDAKSEANMWNILREVRDNLCGEGELANGIKALVTTEDGTLYKDITFKRNAKGKIEMPNAVKETCRRQVEKARKAAKEKAEKEAARKAKKREADRRYRARKKAQKEAAEGAVETIVETVAQPQEA